MRFDTKVNINAEKILRDRGLGGSKDAQRFLAETVERLNQPYVPYQEGHLSKADVHDDKIVYPGPYAHYQYTGIVMAGRAPKHYTGRPIRYNDAPMRGKQWVKRMMADRKADVINALDAYIAFGGR